ATRIGIATLIALMTVPVVYGGLYLWGNHDPYANLDAVPAAIVVDDTGATIDGEAVHYGRDAADELIEDGTFGWTVVSSEEASAGVEDGTYDFALTFPATFSSDLASASGDTPVQAQLVLTTDDRNSYLSTTLAKQAAATVRTTIAQNVGEAASTSLLGAISDIRDGIVDAGDGATTLADGAATLSDGLATLNSETSALPQSASALSEGAGSVADGAATLSGSVSTLATSTGNAAKLTAALRSQVSSIFTAAGVDPTTSAAVLGGFDQLGQLTTGVDGAVRGPLATGASQLATGSSQVADGAATLAASAPDLSAGIASAADGAARLASGSTELRDGLRSALDEIPAQDAATQESIAAAVADPLAVEQDAITEAGSYGAGLAPFFLSLAAWIGIYALFLLVRPLSRRALTAVRRPIRTVIAGWIPPLLLGVVQMVALFLVATLVLQLHVANAVGLLGFMILVSATFAAIVLALNALLGSVGQFLGLLLMIVQLVTAGGTFPWQTLPGPLRVLHEVLPMSHAVDGMRQLMYGGADGGALAAALGALAAWLLGSLAVAALAARRQSSTRRLREIRPSAIGG
ncbi:MAG: YhgE/Pip domain-containing protein, partial [Aeromicrobium sp.]